MLCPNLEVVLRGTGIMCARCLEGFFLQSDDTCAPCVDLGEDGQNQAGDQNQAFIYYGVMSGLMAAVAGFVLHLYLRRDTGAHFVNRLRRCAGRDTNALRALPRLGRANRVRATR